MEVTLSRQDGTRFWCDWHWNQWLGVFALIFLGCLNLLWPLPTLISLAVLIVLLIFILRPYIALVVAIFLIGFDSLSITYYISKQLYWGYGIPYFMAFLGLLCWVPGRLAGINPAYEATSIDLPCVVLYISCVISLLWTPYFRDGLHIVFFLTLSFSLYILISAMNSTLQHLERLFWLCFLLGVIIIITVVVSFFYGVFKINRISDHVFFVVQVGEFDGTRETLKGIMGFPKAIAGVLNICILCGLALLCTRDRRSPRLFIFAGILGMLFIHIMCISRLELFQLFLGWLSFAYLNPQWENKRIHYNFLMAASVVIVVVAVLVFLSSFYTVNILFARLTGQEQTVGYRFSGTQNRMDHIAHALSGTWATGGLGGGVGGIMRGMDPSVWIDSPSLYFSFLTDHGYGILSLILAGWIIVNLFVELRWALRNCPDPRYKILIAGVCSNLVMFGNPFGDAFFFNNQMWVLLGLATVAIKGVHYLLESSPDLSLPRFPHQS